MNEAGPPAVARFTRGAGAVGGGVLLAGGLVLTCAHVVNAALGRRPESAQLPEDPVLVDFPLSRTAANSARVVAWSPLVELGEGDVAVVALDGGASHALEPLPLIVRTVPADELLKVFGFPSYRPKGGVEARGAGGWAVGWWLAAAAWPPRSWLQAAGWIQRLPHHGPRRTSRGGVYAGRA